MVRAVGPRCSLLASIKLKSDQVRHQCHYRLSDHAKLQEGISILESNWIKESLQKPVVTNNQKVGILFPGL